MDTELIGQSIIVLVSVLIGFGLGRSNKPDDTNYR